MPYFSKKKQILNAGQKIKEATSKYKVENRCRLSFSLV